MKRYRCAALALAAGFLIAGCHPGADALLRNRLRWEERALENYAFTLQVYCFCVTELVRPVRVSVRNGAAASFTYVDTGEAAEDHLFERFSTVEKVFDLISAALTAGAYRVDVRYDPEHCFPADVDIDYIQYAIDDELTLRLRYLDPAG